MKRYWISWFQPGEDYRPTIYPPGDKILGYWASGYGVQGTSMCLLGQAENDSDLMEQVHSAWPETVTVVWRFFEEKPENWEPGDRFPLQKTKPKLE